MKLMKRHREMVYFARDMKNTREIPRESIKNIIKKHNRRKSLDGFFSGSLARRLIALEIVTIGTVGYFCGLDAMETTCKYGAIGAAVPIGIFAISSIINGGRTERYRSIIGNVAYSQRQIVDKRDAPIHVPNNTLKDLTGGNHC